MRRECSEQGFKFFQHAAIVTEEEGGAIHTINLCEHCYNGRRIKQGERPVKAAQRTEMMEQKAFRGKLWKVGLWHGTVFTWNVGKFQHQKNIGQCSPGGCGERAAGRHARQVANAIALPPRVSRRKKQATGKVTKKHIRKKVKLVNGHVYK